MRNAVWMCVVAGCSSGSMPVGGTPPEPATPYVWDTASSTSDADGDGFDANVDCDDSDPYIWPGAAYLSVHECDGRDQDCDGIDEGDEDLDGDGVSRCGFDCDDLDPVRAPGFTDAPGDGIDQDCDGTDGVGRMPTLVVGGLGSKALGAEAIEADVDGDGCADLALGETGPTMREFFNSAGASGGRLLVIRGCGQSQLEWQPGSTPGATSMLLRIPGEPGDARDRIGAVSWYTTGRRGHFRLVEWDGSNASVVAELEGESSGDMRSASVRLGFPNRITFGSGNIPDGWTFDLPLTGSWSDGASEWSGLFLSSYALGITQVAQDRDADGAQELVLGVVDTISNDGGVLVFSEPAAAGGTPVETWTASAEFQPFGTKLHPASGLMGDPGAILAGATGSSNNTGVLGVLLSSGPGTHVLDDSATRFHGEFDLDLLGTSADVGDVDGDGVTDVLLGAPGDVNQLGRGKVFLFRGPFDAARSYGRADADAVFVGDERNAHLGHRVLLVDLDGDGLDEMYATAPMAELGVGWGTGGLYRLDL